MFQSDFGIIADYFVKRRKGYKTIENHKQIKHVDEMLKFMKIFAEDERFLQLDIKKDGKGEGTMCTILDAAEERGVKIADDLVEDEIVISPIYKMVKEYPEDTEKDIYQRLN